MTLFELFSIVLMGVIALFGIGVFLGFIVVGAIIINYFRWRHQEKKEARKRGTEWGNVSFIFHLKQKNSRSR